MDTDTPAGFLAFMAGFFATVIGLTAAVGALAIPAPWLGHERATCALVAVSGLTAGLTLLWRTVLRDDYPPVRHDDINERWERDLAACERIDTLDITDGSNRRGAPPSRGGESEREHGCDPASTADASPTRHAARCANNNVTQPEDADRPEATTPPTTGHDATYSPCSPPPAPTAAERSSPNQANSSQPTSSTDNPNTDGSQAAHAVTSRQSSASVERGPGHPIPPPPEADAHTVRSEATRRSLSSARRSTRPR